MRGGKEGRIFSQISSSWAFIQFFPSISKLKSLLNTLFKKLFINKSFFIFLITCFLTPLVQSICYVHKTSPSTFSSKNWHRNSLNFSAMVSPSKQPFKTFYSCGVIGSLDDFLLSMHLEIFSLPPLVSLTNWFFKTSYTPVCNWPVQRILAALPIYAKHILHLLTWTFPLW